MLSGSPVGFAPLGQVATDSPSNIRDYARGLDSIQVQLGRIADEVRRVLRELSGIDIPPNPSGDKPQMDCLATSLRRLADEADSLERLVMAIRGKQTP